ncbi:DmsC/YnfH family molybdoenzyme membrane anchor subunit [Desulfitobacterium sp. THU1]|uniref:dimethyl sulfoxide reductase anchor subunit family protein n=1 Tax=Desulfitobacterium sp. THU1 TaxID=3138072 RepID=UPI00311DCA1B
METWEFPLVLFTVLGQWAIGLALMITLIEYISPAKGNEASLKQLRIGGMAVLPLVALGLIFSVFHLGQPLSAVKALMNLGTSMLSMEILFFSIVGVLALVYSYMWWKTPEKPLRKAVGAVLSVVGLAAIVVTSKVYTLPARMAWDSWQTTAAFILTAILLGAVSVAFLLNKVEDEASQKAKKVMGWAIIGSVVLIVTVLALFAGTYGASTEQSAAVAATFSSGFFIARMVLGILLPVAFAAVFITGSKKKAYQAVAGVTLVGVVLGEVAGRILFYSSVMGQYPWF